MQFQIYFLINNYKWWKDTDLEILVMGDTHCRDIIELPPSLLDICKKVDWIIHTGDYVSNKVLDEFIALKGSQFLGVFGNADPLCIRNRLPSILIKKIGNHHIGIIHPSEGGSETLLKGRIWTKFSGKNLNIIIYGHSHQFNIEFYNKCLLLNPGKAYKENNTFGPPATFLILKIEENGILKVELHIIK